MPELPEVEAVRLSLAASLLGRTLARVDLARRDILTGDADPAALLAGDRVAELLRCGKQLALVGASGRVLLVQLGMSGQFFVAAGDERTRRTHVHARWIIDDDRSLLFRDPRRFGGLTTLASVERLHAHWSGLGPDALTITPAQLAPALARTRRSVKPALLDQGVLAGVGNIYADEALFAARVHPARSAASLREHEVESLASEIRRVLERAIAAGGSTLRDFISGDGSPGTYRAQHAVYGRSGQPCPVCGGLLRSTLLGGRTSVWCPACQPRSAGRSRTAGGSRPPAESTSRPKSRRPR